VVTGLFRRHLPRCFLAVCAALLAACGTEHGRTATPLSVVAPTTVAPTTTTAVPVSYQVKRGDSLTAIAKRFGVSIAVIVATNHLATQDRLTEGQVLQIPPAPPAPPLQLAITPPDGQAGQAFNLTLTGAKPSEVVTFEIDSANGGKFTGPPHTASPNGAVTATYQTTPVDAPGAYNAIARGDHGTSAYARFRVNPAHAPA